MRYIGIHELRKTVSVRKTLILNNSTKLNLSILFNTIVPKQFNITLNVSKDTLLWIWFVYRFRKFKYFQRTQFLIKDNAIESPFYSVRNIKYEFTQQLQILVDMKYSQFSFSF